MTDNRKLPMTPRSPPVGSLPTPAHAFERRSSVPCNGCRVCRQKELVALFPDRGDVVADYETTQLTLENGSTLDIVAQKPNGDCVYLGDQGCTIYDRAPAICRAFDCRKYFVSLSRNERRVMERMSNHKFEVFAAARKRLHTLSAAERRK